MRRRSSSAKFPCKLPGIEDKVKFFYWLSFANDVWRKTSENTEGLNRTLQKLRAETRSLHLERTKQYEDLFRVLNEIESTTKKAMPNNKANSATLSSNDINFLTAGVSNLSIKCKTFDIEHKILASLNYDQRPARLEAIPEAHLQTFSWILSEPSLDGDGSSELLKWLKSGSGVFWVTGKPGSGKSTLMKYITEHAQTTEALATWAAPHRAVTAHHFFWNPGSAIQKSLVGLLRSLLHDIFAQKPDLIPAVCPSQWTAASEPEIRGRHEVPVSWRSWPQRELLSCMRSLATQQDVAVKFCLFVDGLDEYDGDHSDICEFLCSLATSSNIKVCVSSRPWNVFRNFYGSSEIPKICLHDLTRNDIRAYSESRLQGHRRWTAVLRSSTDASALVDEITERSSGVFLWVFLATKVLREGLDNDDSLSDLRRRLNSIPPDLEDFFKKILEGVDPFYHEKMARTLLVALAAREPLRASLYGFMELEYEDEDYALTEAIEGEDHNRKRLHSILDPVHRRLNGRCKGLLEISRGAVEFLHRTLRDYLDGAEMTHFLSQKLKRPFDANLSITRASVACFKRGYFTNEPWPRSYESRLPTRMTTAIRNLLRYARAAEETSEATAVRIAALLDELEAAMGKMAESGQISFTGKFLCIEPTSVPVQHDILLTRAIFRRFLLRFAVVGYIEQKLLNPTDFWGAFDRKVLLRIVFNDELHPETEYRNENDESRRRQLLRTIICHECGSDEPALSQWLSSSISEWPKLNTAPNFHIIFYILSLLLDYGADPNAVIHTDIPKYIHQDDDGGSDTSGIPIWVEYIYSILDHPWRWGLLDDSSYASVLRQMLTRVSDPGALLCPISSRQSMTGWTILIHKLRHQVKPEVAWFLPSSRVHLQSLASVMEVLREFDRESILPWGSEKDFLQTAFNLTLPNGRNRARIKVKRPVGSILGL